MKPIVILLSSALLAGCAVPIETPQATQKLAERFSTPLPQAGLVLDQNWWTRFNDPALSQLLARAQAYNPGLRAAAARLVLARANQDSTDGAALPSVTATANSTVSGQQNTSSTTVNTGRLDASWELDLFARASSQKQASRKRARAEEYTYGGAYVSLSASIADGYVQYRACRLKEKIYTSVLTSQRETVNATKKLAGAGLSTQGDLSLARANAANASILRETTRTNCRIIAQNLAMVVGAPQGEIDKILATQSRLPNPDGFMVSDVPADLLRQRPDIIAAELEFSARLSEIRVARADLYPSLSLSGNVSHSGSTGWQFGPSLSLPIFDGGARRAVVRGAHASAVEAAENYRTAVLLGVSEVEGALTRLAAAQKNGVQSHRATKEYQRYFTAVNENWKAGGETLLNREDARRLVQNAQISEIEIREERLLQWITLYKAVGGGWQIPTPTATATDADTQES